MAEGGYEQELEGDYLDMAEGRLELDVQGDYVDMEEPRKEVESGILMVAAIDFGTTYSGYAYSMKGEYERDKLNIHTNQAWNSGGRSLMSLKTPTCVLIRKENTQFESFGYEAENSYADIVIEGDAENYYFFNRFKMMLYQREVYNYGSFFK